jgi:hypothetical protein
MPPLPWTTISEVDADTDTVVMASRLPLRSYLKVPGFLRRTLQIRKQLAHAPGLVGYALDAQLFRKTFWTVSAWTSREALEQFAGANPHHTATASIRPDMLPTTFVFWTAPAGDLPIAWAEVRRRVRERREPGPSPRRHGQWTPRPR